MNRPSWHAWLLALICLAVLWTRVGGAHLHLCFDGSEPPSSLHLSSAAHHDGDGHGGHHDAGESHSDLDLPLADSPLTKPGKLVQDLSLFLLGAITLLAILGLTRERRVHREPPPLLRWALLHRLPPLRGPPPARRARRRVCA